MEGYLGYGLPDRNRLNASTWRASRGLDRTRTLTNQDTQRLVRAVLDLEAAERPLQQCMRSWGACVLIARHLESTVRSIIVERAGSGAEAQPARSLVGVKGGRSGQDAALDEQDEFFWKYPVNMKSFFFFCLLLSCKRFNQLHNAIAQVA